MNVDFPELLYHTLPGLYRDKDTAGELRRFLEIVAEPLAMLHASITQLQDDYAIERCREELIPLIGTLVGVSVDPTQPARVQRAEVQDAIPWNGALMREEARDEPGDRHAEVRGEVDGEGRLPIHEGCGSNAEEELDDSADPDRSANGVVHLGFAGRKSTISRCCGCLRPRTASSPRTSPSRT